MAQTGEDEQRLIAVSGADADARPQYFVCLLMEYMDKGCLTELVAQEQLSVEELLKAFTQVLKALAYVHSRGLVHCDIKLDNILLDCEKGVKICDFGVSKIIKKGQVIQE